METQAKTEITVETTVNAPIEKIWESFTKPEHITKWNFAADSWQCPNAENDLQKGGNFSYRMEAKDGSFGFDFGGTYDEVEENKRIAYTIADGRKVEVKFIPEGNKTRVIETFEAENQNDIEMQRGGWQAILDNFRKHTESSFQ
jgi:uncharacterized protein YndB with AHSA1/START domain